MSASGKKDGVTSRNKPSSENKVTGTPVKPVTMKESKSDNSVSSLGNKKQALSGKPINSPAGKSVMSSPLSKNYLSKSHESLTTHQQQKLASLQSRPLSSLGLPDTKKKSLSNKENVQCRDKEGFLKPKPLKPGLTSTPIRKSSSQQHIDKSSSGQSKSLSSSSNKLINMKRAHSTQNVSKEKSVKKRTSATPEVMAYNAELLANFEKEKKNQEAKISELIQLTENRKMDIEKYKYEIKKLKEQTPSKELEEEVEILRAENAGFKEQLIKLGVPIEAQITDAEKLSLKKSKKEAEIMQQTSASIDSLSTDGQPVSMMPMVIGAGMKRTPSVTMSEPGISFGEYCRGTADTSSFGMHGKWDNRSKSSDALSDISVANLTERILQMEETHYSTNEELQATLQELGDLQDAVNDLTDENERLADERTVLLESLCTQTEKLEHCRTQIEQLKCLLISGDLPNKSDRDQHLLELLKGAQDEREEFLRKLHAAECDAKVHRSHTEAARDKSQLLEDKITSIKSEKENCEKQLNELKESLANEQIEVAHLKTLLENEKTKVQELESYCKAHDQSDLEELLHNTRQERDKLEERLADVQDALAHSQNEVTKLKDQLINKEEEVKVHRNNAKSQIIDMEYKLELVKKDRYDFQQELEHLREHIEQLEQDSDKYFEERKTLTAKIQELQGEVSVMRQLKEVAESEFQESKLKHEVEVEEWKQFQKDLQFAVVIANDLRSETQGDMEKLKSDNAVLKEECQSLQCEIKQLKSEIDAYKIQERAGAFNAQKTSILSSAELKGKVISSMDKELMHLREGRRIGDKTQTLSVKNLIRSIEEQVKSGCSSIHSSSCSSRRNSDSESSMAGIRDFHEMMKSPSSPVGDNGLLSPENGGTPLRSVLKRSAERPSPLQRHSMGNQLYDMPPSPGCETPKSAPPISRNDTPPSLTSILSSRTPSRRSSGVNMEVGGGDRKETSGKDPLAGLAKSFKGSKRNALLKWCQQKTITYSNVDITNFSSSWNDGLAFCALIHSYLPDKIPYGELTFEDKRRNFTLAFSAGESVGIPSNLNINDMVAMERPDWQAVFTYVTAIYKHFELDNKSTV